MITAKKSYRECTTCSSPDDNKYPSASKALEHLHTVHFECSDVEKGAARAEQRPFDDPCYAYVRPLEDTPELESEIAATTKDFVDGLADVSGKLNKLHWLVATNSRDRQRQRRGGATRQSASPQPPENGPTLPPLPRSLVYLFEELVIYYVLQAKRLSLENRAVAVALHDESQGRQFYARSARLHERCSDKRSQLQEQMKQGRRDIILARGNPKAHGDPNAALGTMAFDTTSFLRVLPLSIADCSFAMRIPRGSSDRGKYLAGSEDPWWDVMGLYEERSKRLHNEAARRPRRRLLLDIQAFQDELDAFKSLLGSAGTSIGR
jgi:hypothetical protein